MYIRVGGNDIAWITKLRNQLRDEPENFPILQEEEITKYIEVLSALIGD